MKLYTQISGAGEPIVFLHTGLETSESDFTYQKPFFSRYYQMILPDLRGHGRSVTNDLDHILADTPLDIKETMDELSVRAFHLVGCSSGALAAFLFALEYPEYVKSLTLAGIFFEKPSDWNDISMNQKKHIEEFLNNEQAVAYMDQLHPETDWRKILNYSLAEDFYPFEKFSQLQQLRMPVHVIAGENAEGEIAGIPVFNKGALQGHVTRIPDSGHLAYQEQPQIFNEAVHQFIQSQDK
jgi:pimeloyl-ACP methyl ester carboxylesterase